MYEIRFHGRGGQGAVMAAQTLAEAAVLQGYHAQAFPYFGAERRGAPVKAFTRIDSKRISLKSQIYTPDMLVVLDSTLPDIEPIAEGLKPDGKAVINTSLPPEEYDLGVSVECVTVDATTIAYEKLKAPIVNTSILGAIARADGIVSLELIVQAIKDKFGEKLGERAGSLNAEAARAAYDSAISGRCKGERALVHKATWLPPWDEIPPGTALPVANMGEVVVGPGSSWQNLTGTWRTQSPYYMKDKCIRCLRCWWSCPEGTIKRQADDYERWDYRYCKGCGICANVCPVSAIEMRKGAREW
ncbi:MAG TPA: 2-oxoacid:acceptor oxidoreductase family protein [Methanomassiliicoccales archaeon]|nr:2-oxoacid:acceptor oxidoreductase family protein [Methanomassiliicoccales archaeon]